MRCYHVWLQQNNLPKSKLQICRQRQARGQTIYRQRHNSHDLRVDWFGYFFPSWNNINDSCFYYWLRSHGKKTGTNLPKMWNENKMKTIALILIVASVSFELGMFLAHAQETSLVIISCTWVIVMTLILITPKRK